MSFSKSQSSAKSSGYKAFKSSWLNWSKALQSTGGNVHEKKLVGLFWGNSDYLLARCFDKTKQLWKNTSSQSAVVHDGKSLQEKDFAMMFCGSTLFSTTDMHIITNAQHMKVEAFEEAKSVMQGALKHHLCFVWRAKEARLPKAFAKVLGSEAMVTPACLIKSYEYGEFVQDLCSSLGLRLSFQARALLIRSAGEKEFFLHQTLNKLKWLGIAGEINEKALLPHLDMVPEQIAFKITQHILEGNKHLAYLTLRDVLVEENTPAVVILGALNYHLKQLILLLSEKRQLSSTPLPYYIKKRYARILPSITEEKLSRALMLAAKTDMYLKSQTAYLTPEILLTNLLVAF